MTGELQKAHSHINILYGNQEGEDDENDKIKYIKSKVPFEPEFNHSHQLKSNSISELDEDAIREALSSTGDKSILIDKVVNVLKLAREVQNSNSELREDIMKMSNIIDDLNGELYEKQLEIEQLINSKSIS